jgi:hypothetical protein
MPNHNTLTKNHVPYTGTFADAAERIAAANLVAADVGKQYLQLDDNSLWQLLSESPSPGWKEIGGFSPAVHAVQVAPNIHPPIRLQYPTQSDRENGVNEVNGIVMSVLQIGQWCEQLDNNTFFKLVQLTPITWKQVNLTYEKTIADMNIYLDFTSGDDDSGDGSIGSPWKTFTRVFRDIQHLRIAHVIKIFPAADTYTDFPSYMDLQFEPGGRIIIDGSVNSYPVVGGPYTIQSIFEVGNQTPSGYALGTQLTVTPTLPAASEPYFGKFMRFTSGNYNGKLVQIYTNRVYGPSTIRTIADYYDFQIGDTFEVVDYPVKIVVDHPIVIKGNDLNQYLTTVNTNNFMVGAVEFSIGNAGVLSHLFLENLNANFAFCRIIDKHTITNDNIVLWLSNSRMNMDSPSGGLYVDSDLIDLFTNGLVISAKDGDTDPPKGYDVAYVKNTWPGGINRVFSRRMFICTAPSLDISLCFCAGITTRPGYFGQTKSTIYALDLYLWQKAFTSTVLELSNCVFRAQTVYQEGGGLPLLCSDDSFFDSLWYQGNTSYIAAMSIHRRSAVHVNQPTSRTQIQGTSYFATWEFDGSGTASKPGDGSFVQKADSFLTVQGGGS